MGHLRLIHIIVLLTFSITLSAQSRFLTENDFDNCVELSNQHVRVILTPYLGGRILKYEVNGKNVLYVDPAQNGLTEKPKGMYKGPSAGRFDFGPVRVIPRHNKLWWGTWEIEITGKYSARMISQTDTLTGVQLIRDFTLDEYSSKLTCTQTIRNVSREVKRYCYWGRTFVNGGGVSIVPLNPESRYPKQYISYGKNKELFYEPENEMGLTLTKNLFIMDGTSMYKKYVMDGTEGWMAYVSTDNLFFVKKFRVFPEKIYGEMTGCTASLWFFEDKIVEIEPMGPWEWIEPGKEISFTEEWFLYDLNLAGSKSDYRELIRKYIDWKE